MLLLDKEKRKFSVNNDYLWLLITFIFALIVFDILIIYENKFSSILSKDSFLAWHTIFELLNVIFSFIIFNNCYYSYKHTKRLRIFIFSLTFLLVGVINFLYVVSFDSAVQLFIQESIDLTVIYFIMNRFIMALGIFFSSIIPYYKKSKINEKAISVFDIITFLIIFLVIKCKFCIIPDLFFDGYGTANIREFLDYIIIALEIFSIGGFIRNYIKFKDKYIIVICCGLILCSFGEIMFILYKNLYDVYNLLGHAYRSIGIYLIYYSVFKYQIDIPYFQFKRAQDTIRLYANNLEKIIDRRTREIKEVNERLLSELEHAKKIQQSLLPDKRIEFSSVIFLSEYIPCERLSGDFFDIYEIDKDNVGMYILDVSGHGISAALLTMFTNHYIKSTERLIKRYRGLKPHKNLMHFYEEFNKLNFPEEMHIVIFFANYNLNSKVLTYCSGGLNCYPILIRKNGDYEFLDKSQGFPICKFSEFFTPEYTSVKIGLNKGDRILFYTDGLIDKKKNKAISKRKLIDILIDNRNNSIEILNSKILQEINRLDNKFDDDITYFIMEAK
ncbi:MASE3 domain-containing protein [Caminicella sporogenes]|uniref:MASE3 domain-containing protein n=1 Tax=Caminicella sporogenes TaxID=166485 RepID=UPI002541EB92|nr:MASE3 domain-containing protein [Caminicella sporogenes]WIF94982.1 MASE3 domain-containing protein [Caminicella sporogenes]